MGDSNCRDRQMDTTRDRQHGWPWGLAQTWFSTVAWAYAGGVAGPVGRRGRAGGLKVRLARERNHRTGKDRASRFDGCGRTPSPGAPRAQAPNLKHTAGTANGPGTHLIWRAGGGQFKPAATRVPAAGVRVLGLPGAAWRAAGGADGDPVSISVCVGVGSRFELGGVTRLVIVGWSGRSRPTDDARPKWFKVGWMRAMDQGDGGEARKGGATAWRRGGHAGQAGRQAVVMGVTVMRRHGAV